MLYNYDVSLEIEIEENTFEIFLDVSATPVPYTRATYDSPQEGGYFDDVELVKIVEVFRIDNEGGQNETELTDKIRLAVDKAMIEQSDEIQRQIGEEEYQRWEGQKESC